MPTSPLRIALRSPRVRRTLAAVSVVLATGGLVLHRAPASADPRHTGFIEGFIEGKNATSFSGTGIHGTVALSHTRVLAGHPTSVFADVRVHADAEDHALSRAPIALAIVLDTSGSMQGEKIEDAKRSLFALLGEMHDEDEIAVVRYSDTSELVQPLARVSEVRSSLREKVAGLRASGGTNIASGLSEGLRALDDAARGRVRRIVLASDGLDDMPEMAERLAQRSSESGITVSSLGVGVDFDEAYMARLAETGHGNFAFVKDGTALATFLRRELEEATKTTIENAHVHVTLPPGVSFVSASGAGAHTEGHGVDLAVGSLFAGDDRRIVVELAADLDVRGTMATTASWSLVDSHRTIDVEAPPLLLVATNDASEVERGKDRTVLARAGSVLSSRRQFEAASAFSQGDATRARALAATNERSLVDLLKDAPPSVAPSIEAQLDSYRAQTHGFFAASPESAADRSAAKASAAKESANLGRQVW